MSWRSVKKIDAHVHILPEDKRTEFMGYNGPDAPWSGAGLERYLELMDRCHIERALLLPTNDGYLYYGDADRTNQFLSQTLKKYPGRFYAFADILANGAYFIEESPYLLEKAVKEYGLHGLKIHPTNLHMDADDLRLVPVLRKAAELGVPVMFHANPCMLGFHDNCAPDKINHMIQVFPDLRIITAHMGGMKYLDALTGCTYVDMSYILPELVKLYGIPQANRILRAFGPSRLIFGTDFPDRGYEEYFDILDQMDFTDEEIERIAWKNIERLLGPAEGPQ